MIHRSLFVVVLLLANVAVAQEPALPEGLGGEAAAESPSEPALPAGLGGEATAESPSEPALPAGLGEDADAPVATDSAEERWRLQLPPGLIGFWDNRIGWRTQSDPWQDESRTLTESRLQLDYDRRLRTVGVKIVADFLYDDIAHDHGIDLNRGEGWLDLRQANISLSPFDHVDLKIGRQILTWGTGDLLFINDNFPKDWVSFFVGRDVEYLKAPSDAIKASMYFGVANLDLVYTPQFDPDRHITGDRLSYYSGAAGGRVGNNPPARSDAPDRWFEDDEWAARLHRNLSGYELAAYGYHGFWKSPAGQDVNGDPTFPALAVYGASLRGPFLRGIGNVEVGYYDSRDDRDGDDPNIRNSEWRFLAGYEQDLAFLAPDLNIGLQYYVEWMQDHDAFILSHPSPRDANDEDRHVVTLRLTKLLMRQNLELSWFSYWSPTDRDAFTRPAVSYKITDHWRIMAGANIFLGDNERTFFSQFEHNSNVYAGLRLSF